MELTLFTFKPEAVRFDELRELSFDWFKSNTNTLDDVFK